MSETKIGAGSFSAWMRQGLREIRAALYPESNIAQAVEYGQWGTKTQGEVAADRKADTLDIGEEHDHSSVIDERMQRAQHREDLEPDMGEDMDLDMGE